MKRMLRGTSATNVFEGRTTNGGVNPRRTIQALALRTADHIDALARRSEL